MALVVADRVRETCFSPGTGDVTLLGPAVGYQEFSVIGNTNTTYYCIADQSGGNWEVGIGTYTSSTNSLSRDTILSSSNSGSIVNFSAGTQDIFITYPSEKSVYVAGTNVVPNTAATLPITSGGTGQSTKTDAFDALSPTTTLGDTIYNDGTDNVRLAGNTTTTRKFYRQTGTGTVSAAPAWDTVTSTDVGLSNVTNDAQTKAAIVPNTAPTAGQVLVGNAGGTAYAPVSMSSDATLASTGALTLATVNSNVGSFTNASVTVDGKGRVTAASSGTAPVTSVGATSPVASSGGTTPTISLNSGYGDTLNPYASKTQNYVLASPNGSAGVPTFRALVAADIPTLNQNTTGSAASLSISGQTGLLTFTGLTTTNRTKTVRDAADTILELGGSYTPTGTWNWTSATVTWPVFGVANGGTGLTSIAALSIPVANTSNTYTTVTGTANQSIRVNAGGTAWEAYTPTSGTVTSVAALTLGTTGTDLSSTVATGTTTPVITLNVPTASATNRGALSSTDWSTFNGKQAAYANLTSIGGLANSAGWLYNNGSGTFSYSTPTASNVGLGNVTNDTQTKASIVPNTVPTAGQLHVGNAGGTAFGVVSMSGDATLASTGALTLATVNSNVGSFTNANITVDAKGRITAASSGTSSVTPAQVSDQANTSTGYFDLPAGTTAQRPASPATGMVRFNSTLKTYEGYTGTDWTPFATATVAVDYLVIAGGGAGGNGSSAGGYGSGGGGAGGYRTSAGTSGGGGSAETILSLSYGVNYTVTVGAGGTAGGSDNNRGGNGNNSAFSTITSLAGGGGGGSYNGGTASGADGGSGGGGGNSDGSSVAGGVGTSLQGYGGGTGSSSAAATGAAGGGGAGSAGASYPGSSNSGNGGSGVASSITGSSVTRGGGGGGGSAAATAGTASGGGGAGGSNANGTAGSANTGGGGGGAGGGTGKRGGAGGSGVVIISFPTASATCTVGAGLTYSSTTSGSNTVITFTAGTGTISFAQDKKWLITHFQMKTIS